MSVIDQLPSGQDLDRGRLLVNLDHLDWLRVPVTLRPEPGHTTYRIGHEPAAEMLWTYAERDLDGGYRRVGGGRYDPDTDRWSQGAFNADDVARAAVVYLRHWVATGGPASRDAAYQLLRGLAFLQTTDGRYAGSVVLWMQPDGTLNPSADPPEKPDPSDGDESFWLARTVWAFGEGYAAFRTTDPGFAAFLADRLRLALAAVRRRSLSRFGHWYPADGTRVPAWLIAGGADATGEALLGLAAAARVGHPGLRAAIDRLAGGVAAMGAGTPWSWPYGAILPSALDPGVWHAWGGLAPAGLARAYGITGDPALRDAALADAAGFTPYLLATGGPDNSWRARGPVDRVQIAYGAHARIESLLATAEAARRPLLVTLAGIAASWFFGNNPAGLPTYDPGSGRTCDGIDPPGLRHQDSGAESTIHGLLAMLALDAHPGAAAVARTADRCDRGSARDLEWLVLAEPGTRHATALVRSLATGTRRCDLAVPGAGPAVVSMADRRGALLDRRYAAGTGMTVEVAPGGFTIVRR